MTAPETASDKGGPTVRRVLKNAASILLGDAMGQILVGVAISITAVRLGPAQFGVLSEAQAFIDPFDAVAGFGLQQVAITMAARRGGCDGTLRGTMVGLQACFALLALMIAFPLAFGTSRSGLVPVLCVLAVNTFVLRFQVMSMLPFQYSQTMHLLIAIPTLASVVRLGATYAAARAFNTPVGHQIAALAAAMLQAGATYALMRRFQPARLHFDRGLAKSLLKIAWPAAVLEVVVLGYSRASYFFLHAVGPVAQGEYAAADRLVRPVLALAGALGMSGLPAVSAMAVRREYRALKALYLKSILRVFAILTPIVFASWFLAGFLLSKTRDYHDATTPFRVLSVGAVFMFVNQISTVFAVAMGKFRAIMFVACANLVVYLSLASWMVPRWHAIGAAASTTAMEAVNTMMQLVIVLVLIRRGERDHAAEPASPSDPTIVPGKPSD